MKTKSVIQKEQDKDMAEVRFCEMEQCLRLLVGAPRGHRRAANMIRFIASELAKQEACEDLANAAKDCQDMLVRAWENRWEREREKAGQ